ncbi:YybS family protein [Oceanobacillus chungangensis]|uniref:DUF2232 domain-containing protein n=1 Tax=Oceanobacillus chungangensis TaxID=1229152 RepID=A0A3D8PL92_9BACI|nr:YybS family protein [Oceanobacillus chungangensis]RDW16774.1 DUF2232 domain-containing protein [Oceanobacillus chungangensis]
MNQSKKITEGALFLAVFMILMLLSMFIPIFTILLPVPFILYSAKYDWKPTLIVFVGAILFGTIITTLLSLPVIVLMGLGGIMIGNAIYKNLSAYETLARGTFGFIIGLLFSFVFTQVVADVNIVEDMNQMVEESITMSSNLMEEAGMQNQQTEEFEELLQMQSDLLMDLLPAFVIFLALILAFLTQWIGYKFINKLFKKKLRFPPFRTLQFPSTLLWIYMIVLVFSIIETDPASTLFVILQNASLVTGTLMIIQGFSFIFFFAHHKRLPIIIPILAVLFTLFIPTILLSFVRILGIIDIGFKLRDRLTKKN